MVFPNLTVENADVWGTSIRSGTDASLCALMPIDAVLQDLYCSLSLWCCGCGVKLCIDESGG
jgi:hypothetical protein